MSPRSHETHTFFLKAGPPISNLVPFRERAESILKIYVSMGNKMYAFPKQNACFRPDLAASRPDLAASREMCDA